MHALNNLIDGRHLGNLSIYRACMHIIINAHAHFSGEDYFFFFIFVII